MSEPMPCCWNCDITANERPLKKEGQNWICDPCETEIDASITVGKAWAHVTEAAQEVRG